MEHVDAFLCSSMWGSSSHGYSYRPSVGASGELLILWDCEEVEIFFSSSFDHVLVVSGRFVKSNEDFVLFNVYAPCDVGSQQVLWGNLSNRLAHFAGCNICVCRDFNVVRKEDERKRTALVSRVQGVSYFNSFIDVNVFVDIPLIGRRFTWYRGDGRSMSRIDRFLLSEKWCLTWLNSLQLAQLRGLSDHCALVLSVDEQNWGLKPFHMFKCWEDIPGYKNFVSSKWRSFQVEGWGGYVMKEKIKMIKVALREWHQEHTHNIPGKNLNIKNRIYVLDEKGELSSLTEEEVKDLHGLSSELHSLSRMHSSICWQQSRLNWIQEGDANSKFFHGTMSSRWRANNISILDVGGVSVEGVDNVRTAVFNHFSDHFKAPRIGRPQAMDLSFRQLSYREGADLIRPFNVDEVKVAVWDCDSYKCLGLDGVNFGFTKDLWVDMKDDLMRFLSGFHRNGKLLKGINSTFITLIPKKDCLQRLNDYRPISLVGSLYKVLAKLLANRLKGVIGSVVSDSQSTIVKGRQILDGILAANEVVDEAKKIKQRPLAF